MTRGYSPVASLLNEIITKNPYFKDFEVEQEFSTIGREKILLKAHQIQASEGLPPLILLALEDIFTKKRLRTGNVGYS